MTSAGGQLKRAARTFGLSCSRFRTAGSGRRPLNGCEPTGDDSKGPAVSRRCLDPSQQPTSVERKLTSFMHLLVVFVLRPDSNVLVRRLARRP